MLARECPNLLAELFEEIALPDFSHDLRQFETFRTAYRLMRTPRLGQVRAKDIRKSLEICSPVFGASTFKVMDFNLDIELMDITPPTQEMKAVRKGNLTWRRGASFGNPKCIP
ncbi:unnamed protein product [Effrenium voratum]|uniref:Uncharacterized protein n=1 Tax=Effrenium voratum TaxID=2562239 RepID=A0AA36HQH7_9DINO|nr:unnamed protein product [Effrenium voratum]